MWMAVFILFLLFTACGVFMIVLQKDEDRKNILYFLTARKLNNQILYQDAAVSVSDIAVLKNISLRLHTLPELRNNIQSFTVHSYKEKKGIPVYLSFSAEKVSLRLLDIARQIKPQEENVIDTLATFDPIEDITNHPLYALLLAGCNQISVDMTGEYSYLPEKKRMTLKTRFSDQCLGKADISVSLSNISNAQQGRLVLALKHFLKRGNPLEDLKDFLNGATITDFSLTYTEAELVKGYKKYVDELYLRLPETASPAEPAAKGIQKIVSYLSLSNAHRQRNTDVAQTLARFIKDPQTIRFQSKKGKQVPLNILGGTFLRRLTDMLLRLDTSVAVENTIP